MNNAQRPQLKIDTDLSNDIETFQSVTLRPILKMQNKLIIEFFNQNIVDKKIDFNKLESLKKTEIIHQILKKELVFKSFMIGLVCGQMNETEFAYYMIHKIEINKRLTAMLIERINSQIL